MVYSQNLNNLKIAQRMKSSQLEECVLCCRDIKIYAVGACDHPVCYECSTRMRVLCETNECPICRSNVPVVVFTHEIQAFSTVEKKFSSHNKTYNILFEDETIAAAFDSLLENKCKSCGKVTPNFNKLKEHVRREHELHFCDLCTDNLKIFTFERKCYSRKDLARHKRVGDPDETSHRGHPLCEFCDQRYVDRDDLFRHLRREHYFCHFCDADGKHQYYKDYDYLRVHFRKDHYLCEEGNCATEKFTAAFRSEIDLKAHIAVHHSKNKSKQEVKQTRLLEFEFAPHPRHSGSSSPRGGRFSQQRKRNEDENIARERYRASQQPEAESLNTQSMQDFPYLSDDVAGKAASGDASDKPLTLSSFNRNAPQAYRKNAMSAEDFPALCPAAPSASKTTNNQIKKANYSAPSLYLQNSATKQSTNDKPPKKVEPQNGDRASLQKGKWMNKKGNINFEDDFPSLEVRKSPVTVTQPVPKTISSVQSSTAANRLVNTAPKPPVTDQFVVIKSKSKKKKPNKINTHLDFDDDENSSSSNSTVKVVQNDQENDDPFKKHLVHPLLSSKPPSAQKSDHWGVEEVSFGNEDFPPLAPTEPAKKPPGFNIVEKPRAPPPGFNSQTKVSKPAAVHKSLSTRVQEIVMPKQNGSEKLAKDTDEEHSYIKPPDFNQRNDKLIERIFDLTKTDVSLFEEFKVESGKFRYGTVSAAEYHSKCLEILGVSGFLEIFPELISLLPDIKKQQELLTVHNTFLSHKSGGAISKKIPKAASPVVSCNSCNQVLMNQDSKSHALSHDLVTAQ